MTFRPGLTASHLPGGGGWDCARCDPQTTGPQKPLRFGFLQRCIRHSACVSHSVPARSGVASLAPSPGAERRGQAHCCPPLGQGVFATERTPAHLGLSELRGVWCHQEALERLAGVTCHPACSAAGRWVSGGWDGAPPSRASPPWCLA